MIWTPPSHAGVILVRHGSTEYNKSSVGASAERLRGWKDIPLDEKGRKEAHEIAKRLEDDDIEEIHSSPLVRAAETAEVIAKAKDLDDFQVNRALMPWNVGDWAGQKVSELLPELKKLAEYENKAPPGGEPFRDFRERFLSFIIALIDKARDDKHLICAVTHSRNVQCAKAWMAAGCPDDMEIDMDTMNDYKDETPTGEALELPI